MEKEFWQQCWENDHIGWHQDDIHPWLPDLLVSTSQAANRHMLVPLCGKSKDMLYLGQFGRVSGVELSELACEQFYQENNLEVSKVRTAQGSLYTSSKPPVSIYQGDFFSIQPALTGSVDLIYDRAALIALPEAMRKRYVEHLKGFMVDGTRVLLFSLEYPQRELQGPPFSVRTGEIEELFAGFHIEKLKERDLTGNKFARRSLHVSSLIETAYLISA